MPDRDAQNLTEALNSLPPKATVPVSARVLNTWIAQAQDRIGTSGPRLGWLVAATVVSAAMQRAVDRSGAPMFLLKGGTMLQYRLPGMSRTTQDIDGLIRGDIDEFLAELDMTLCEPWGPLTLVRGDVADIPVPHRATKPRRFDVTVLVNGVKWRRVPVEISPDEGHAGAAPENIPSPSLAGLGLPAPAHLASLSIRYQIAQKVHASTTPHNPPESVNHRARDVVDLLLLRDFAEATGHPTLTELRSAIVDVFAARTAEAEIVGATPRTWPARLATHPHWESSYASAAESAELVVSLADAVAAVNAWLDRIERA